MAFILKVTLTGFLLSMIFNYNYEICRRIF